MKQNLQARLVSLLCAATEQGEIVWQQLPGQCYHTVKPTAAYHLRWLYWYNQSGITIDRQGIIVSAGSIDMSFLWGTSGVRQARKLLEAIDDTWLKHHRQIDQECLSMNDNHPQRVLSERKHDACLQLLFHMMSATKSGVISWGRGPSDFDIFYADYAGRRICVTYLKPADQEDRPLGNLVAEVSFQTANIRFACGTDGFFMLEEMLAIAFKDRRQKLDEDVDLLRVEIAALSQLVSLSK